MTHSSNNMLMNYSSMNFFETIILENLINGIVNLSSKSKQLWPQLCLAYVNDLVVIYKSTVLVIQEAHF